METLAYIHCASAYEESSLIESVKSEDNAPVFDGLNWKKFSTQAWLYLLPFAIALGVLGISDQAQAAVGYRDYGYKVFKLQNKLKRLGYFPRYVRSTGYFGSITANAVIRFQSHKGLYQDAIVGPRTKRALKYKHHRRYARHRVHRVVYRPCYKVVTVCYRCYRPA